MMRKIVIWLGCGLAVCAILLLGSNAVQTRARQWERDRYLFREFSLTRTLLMNDKGSDRLHEFLKARLYYLADSIDVAELSRLPKLDYGPVDESMLGEIIPFPRKTESPNDYYRIMLDKLPERKMEISDEPSLGRLREGMPVREALIHAWDEIQALNDPILSDAATVEPSFEEDSDGLRGARLSLIKNAVCKPKGRPAPVDPSLPYIWIAVSVWREGSLAQPSVRTRSFRADNADYAADVWVEGSDAMLARRIETILSKAFESQDASPTTSPLGPPSQSPTRCEVEDHATQPHREPLR